MRRIAETRPVYAWSVASLLALTQMFSFIDRQILSLLIGPIRADLAISDTQVALLHGFAFVLFYSVMGIPLGRWADRGNRPLIIAVGLGFWSIATASCGLARNFWSLFAARICVGVGEASLSPSALSLLADYFDRARLGRAIGLYMGGIYLGSGLAFIVGGALSEWAIGLGTLSLPLVGDVRGWQVTFLIVGLPGLVLTLAYLFVREPRLRSEGQDRASVDAPGLSEVWRHLRRHRDLFARHYAGFGIVTALLYGMMFWVPQTFVRAFGSTIAEAGLYFGIATLLFGPLGTFAGGWLADHGLRGGRARAPMQIAAVGFGFALPAVMAFAFAPTVAFAVAACMPLAFLLGFPLGIATSSLQLMTPARMRGQGAAIYYITVNLIGFVTGPLSVALMTDYVFRRDSALPLSLAASAALFVPIGCWLFWTAREPFARELKTQTDTEADYDR